MPHLPDFMALGATTTPQASRTIAQYHGTTGFEDVPGRVTEEAGAIVHQAGNQLSRDASIVRTEQERYDTIKTEDAFNKLREAQISLTLDPQSGFANLKGMDATNPKVIKDYTQRFKAASSQISAGLDNENQRNMFARRNAVAENQYHGEILRHVGQQSEISEQNVTDAGIKLEVQKAALDPLNQNSFEMSMTRAFAMIDAYGQHRGQGPESPETVLAKQRVVNDANMLRVRTQMVRDPRSADTLYEALKPTLSANARLELEQQLKVSVLPLIAKDTADKIVTPDGLAALGRMVSMGVNSANTAADAVATAAPTGSTAPVSARDTKAMIGGWISAGAVEAERVKPGDPIFRDLVVSEIKNRASTVIAAEEGIQRQAHSFLLNLSAGVSGGQVVGRAATSLSQLLSSPEARSAWARLDDDSIRGIQARIDQNAARAEGKPAQVNAALVQNLFTRMYLNPDDPRAVTKPEQLTPYIAQGLTPQAHSVLMSELDKLKDGTPAFQRSVQGARRQFDRISRSSIATKALADIAPERFEEANYAFTLDLNQKIDEFKKAGKDPRALITPGNPDFMLAPGRVQSYFPNVSDAMNDTANAVRAAAAKGPTRIKDETDFMALKVGAQYIDPDGKLRVKSSEAAYEVGKAYDLKQGTFKFKGGEPWKLTNWEPVK